MLRMLFLSTLGVCLAQPSGWAVLTLKEYEALRAKPGAVPEFLAALARIEYDLRVDGASAAGKALLTIDAAKAGEWVTIPLPSGLAISASSEPVVALAKDRRAVVLRGAGRSIVALDVALPVSGDRVVLPPSGAAITQVTLTPPARDVSLTVTGGIVIEESPVRWRAFGAGDGAMQLTWKRRTVERPVELPLRARGEVTQVITLGEDSATVAAEISVDVLQGAMRQIRISVPAAVTINEVPGAIVGDWDVANGELTVNFLEAVERLTKFTITGEVRAPRDGAIDIPLLRLKGLERETGGAAVEVLGAGEIKSATPEGLVVAEANSLGALIASRQSPIVAAFRLPAGAAQRALRIQLARYTQQAVITANVEQAGYHAIAAVDGKTLIEARYTIRSNQRNFLRVKLPAGARLWSTPVRPGTHTDGALLFPISSGEAEVRFSYLLTAAKWTERGQASFALPALDLPVSRTSITLHHPPTHRIAPAAGAFRAGAASDIGPSAEFPSAGPSIALIAELTPENASPSIAFQYETQKLRGGL